MQKFKVLLSSVNDVKRFVNAATLQTYEIDVISGRYVIDAKSIMGIFSMDLVKPLSVEADCTEEECSQFKALISDYLVEGS